LKRLAALFFLLIPGLATADVNAVISYPSGGNGDVQFNRAGRFGSDPGDLYYSTSTVNLTSPNITATYGLTSSTATLTGQLNLSTGTLSQSGTVDLNVGLGSDGALKVNSVSVLLATATYLTSVSNVFLSSVSVSSNAILSGTTFYQGGNSVISGSKSSEISGGYWGDAGASSISSVITQTGGNGGTVDISRGSNNPVDIGGNGGTVTIANGGTGIPGGNGGSVEIARGPGLGSPGFVTIGGTTVFESSVVINTPGLLSLRTSSNTLIAGSTFYSDAGMVYGGAAGGDRGLGTINAEGFYVDGVEVGGTPEVHGMRNRIINGQMAIDQIFGGAVDSVADTDSDSIDMWYSHGTSADGVFSQQRLSDTPPAGFQFYFRRKTTTADASVVATQSYYDGTAIEGYNVADFLLGTANAVQFTMSFWTRSSLTGTFGGAFVNGAANRSYPFQYTISAANTWEKKTITLTGDVTGTWLTTTGKGLEIRFDLGSGSDFLGTADAWAAGSYVGATGDVKLISTLNATLDIAGLQLEKGASATSFDYRPYAQELALCQRYFCKSYYPDIPPGTGSTPHGWEEVTASQIAAAVVRSGTVHFPVEMKGAPSIALYQKDTGTSGKWTWSTTDGIETDRTTDVPQTGPRGFTARQSAAIEYFGSGHWVADARL